MTWHVISRGLVCLVLLAACGCGSSVSDTGFTGAWRRQTPAGPSVLSLAERSGSWSVAWRVDSGTRTIRCDDEGVCDELESDQVIYVWRLSAERRAGEDALFVTRAGEPVRAGTSELTEVMRCELEPGGLALVAHVVERNGTPLARPAGPYRYDKIADDPRRTDP